MEASSMETTVKETNQSCGEERVRTLILELYKHHERENFEDNPVSHEKELLDDSNIDQKMDNLRGTISIHHSEKPVYEFRPLPDETYQPAKRETCESCKGKGCESCGSLGFVFHHKARGDIMYLVGKGRV